MSDAQHLNSLRRRADEIRAVVAALTLIVVVFSSPSGLSADDGSPPGPASDAVATLLGVLIPDNGTLAAYDVPVHIEAQLHKLFTFRFGFNGTESVQRPDQLALDIRAIPERFRALFAQLGVPLTWAAQYDLTLVDTSTDHGRTHFHILGRPKTPGQVDHLDVVFTSPSDPVLATWTCTDGSTITMTIQQGLVNGYELPTHAEAIVNANGMMIQVALTYGTYAIHRSVVMLPDVDVRHGTAR